MAKKISVIIPNYNGKKLLEKNLPFVLENCKGCEIIVVDDNSIDDSVDLINKKFKDISLIKLKNNKGFTNAVNIGIKESDADLVLLLNSDVAPRSGFLEKAVAEFKNDKLFGVALADISHENNKEIIRGNGRGVFKKGFLQHSASNKASKYTLWVSGGSGLFNKNKVLELGGFDINFAPFYWEDIDLCYKAWKRGYQCVYAPNAKIDHYHDKGAIKTTKSKITIKSASYKNQFLFIWKNISDYYLITQHILWLPYHLIRSIATFDYAFFIGLIWAISKIPFLIFNDENLQYKVTDKEILKIFEK